MASLRLKGKVWYACIALPNGKRTQVSTKKRDEGAAADRATQRRHAVLIAQSLEELALGDPTETHIRKTLNYLFERVGNRARVSRPVDGYLDEWLQRVKLHHAPNTHMRYKGIASSFLASLGNRRGVTLAEVSVADIQAWIDQQLRRGKRESSVYSAWQTLGIPFTAALKQGLISTNPVPLAEVPRFSRQSSRLPFTGAQIAAILQAADGEWRTAVMLGAFTGARIGDASSMKWSAVDLPAGVLRYLPKKTQRTGTEVVIPLHPALHAHLTELQNNRPAGCEYLCPGLLEGPRGKPVLSLQFKAILRKAGIETEHIEEKSALAGAGPGRHRRPRFSFHGLRHSFASLLANAGVPREVRKELIGHTTDRIHNGYSHLGLATMRSAIMQLPALDQVGLGPRPVEQVQPATLGAPEKSETSGTEENFADTASAAAAQPQSSNQQIP